MGLAWITKETKSTGDRLKVPAHDATRTLTLTLTLALTLTLTLPLP